MIKSNNVTTMSDPDVSGQIPILLLKTRSTPHDGYEEYFRAPQAGRSFDPIFVPVLEHKFLDENLEVVRGLLKNKEIRSDGESKYGGMIFTSQRAVEAFAKIVAEDSSGTHLSRHSS